MWLLEILGVGPHPVRYHLVGGTSYTLGRRDCTIQLPPNDPSISRHQCTLIVKPTDVRHITTMAQLPTTSRESIERRRRNLSRTGGLTQGDDGRDDTAVDAIANERLRGQATRHYAMTPEVILLDTSKHGCYVNDERVDTVLKRTNVGEHDVIRLGAHVEISLFYRPIVATLSPTLSGLQCNNVSRVLTKLGCAINNPRRPVVSADAAITASPSHTKRIQDTSLVIGGAGKADASVRARNNMPGDEEYGGAKPSSPARGVSQNALTGTAFNNTLTGSTTSYPPPASPPRRTSNPHAGQFSIRYVPQGKAVYERAAVTASRGDFSMAGSSSPGSGDFGREEASEDGSVHGEGMSLSYSPADDIRLYLDPQTAQDKHFSPITYVYVTERMQLNEPTCMMSMLLGYRPVNVAYLFTLYEVLLQSPATPMTRWPEPQMLEEMTLVDRPYFKTPVFLLDFRHHVPKTFTSVFRLLNFGALEHRLHDQYREVIVKGGGRCFFLDPAKVNTHFGDSSRFQKELPSCDASVMNASVGGASSVGGLSRATSMAFSMISGGTALTRGGSGTRRSRRLRAKKIPASLKLMGLVDSPLDAHGVNLRVLISEPMFAYLTQAFKRATERRKKEHERRARNRLHHAADNDPLNDTNPNTSRFTDDEELPPEAFGVSAAAADAALNLFDNGYLLVHEDNVHSAIYTNDPASQFKDTSPGVLAKRVMVDKADQTDSDDTVDEDEERLHEYHKYNLVAITGGDNFEQDEGDKHGGGGFGGTRIFQADGPGGSPGHSLLSPDLNQSPLGSAAFSPTMTRNDYASTALPDDDPVSLLLQSRRRHAASGSPYVRVRSAQQVNTVTAYNGEAKMVQPKAASHHHSSPVRMAAAATPTRQLRR